MRKFPLSIILSLMLLQGCASAPRAIVQAVCPVIPPLAQKPALQEPTFSDRTASFLQGRLPEPTDSDYSLPNAKLPTQAPEKQSTVIQQPTEVK